MSNDPRAAMQSGNTTIASTVHAAAALLAVLCLVSAAHAGVW